MSLERAKKGIKRFGYIWVIVGAIVLVLGVILILGGRVAAADVEKAENAARFTYSGIVNVILGLVGIDAGYRCFKAVKDSKKLRDVKTIASIGIGLAILAILGGFVKGTLAPQNLSTCIASIVVNGLLYYETHVVKKGLEAENN